MYVTCNVFVWGSVKGLGIARRIITSPKAIIFPSYFYLLFKFFSHSCLACAPGGASKADT